MATRNYMGIRYALTLSPHDDGWYAEVWGADGVDLHVTEIHSSAAGADSAARRWIRENCPRTSNSLGATKDAR